MKQDEIIEAAIQGHASTRDAIRWAMNVAVKKQVEEVCLCKDKCLGISMYLCKGLPSPLAAQPPQPEQEPEQKRPQNCGTGYCSCIECVMTPSPRAWLIEFENGDEELHFDEQLVGEIHVPLYTHPPRRKPWVDLTDEEIQVIAKKARSKDHAVTLTNKFLREKNT